VSDDDGPAWAAFLARVDPAALERERFTSDELLRRHDAIRAVLSDQRRGRLTNAEARALLHDIDPEQYPETP
jgi:hypothetical protein